MNESPIKVKHHYVPVMYLRWFTPSKNKDDMLHVLDLDTGRNWKGAPNSVAFENNYNSVEGDLRSDALEDSFAQIESSTAPIWYQMIQSGQIPSDPTDLNWVMNFISLLVARTKPNRKMRRDLQEASLNKMMDLVTATPERFEFQIRKMEQETNKPIELPADVTLEETRLKYLEGAFELKVDLHNNLLLSEMLKNIDAYLKLFHAREWSVIDFKETGCEIVTSDDPVSITWSIATPSIKNPGFGMENTRVFIPLSSEKVLVGAFKESLLQIPPSLELARKINHITLAHAFRFVFSATGSPVFQSATDETSHPSSIDALIKTRQHEGRTSDKIKFVNEWGPMISLSRHYSPHTLLM